MGTIIVASEVVQLLKIENYLREVVELPMGCWCCALIQKAEPWKHHLRKHLALVTMRINNIHRKLQKQHCPRTYQASELNILQYS